MPTFHKLDMLNKIYDLRQQDFEKEDKKDRIILSKILNDIKIEDIEKSINNLQEEQKLAKQIELLIENYEIQIAYYSQKNYKQGFKDAMRLYTQCLEDEET